MLSAPPEETWGRRERLGRLARAAVGRLCLDLGGATVLTEAATGPFATTPTLAVAAGAERVLALPAGPPHGNPERIAADLAAALAAVGVGRDKVELLGGRDDVPAGIDVVTNLGGVGPVDEALVARLSAFGVVSTMSEAWEAQPQDVDLAACRAAGVPVAGVFEDFDGLACSGPAACWPFGSATRLA